MIRRFHALVALLLLVSLGLWVSGPLDAGETTHPLTLATAEAEARQPDGAERGPHAPGQAHDHGLADTQPEPPEQMHLDARTLLAAHKLSTPAAPLLHLHAPPALAGLRRPPRA